MSDADRLVPMCSVFVEGDEPFTCSVAEFLAANECLDEETIADIREGREVQIGGGAAPFVRVVPVVCAMCHTPSCACVVCGARCCEDCRGERHAYDTGTPNANARARTMLPPAPTTIPAPAWCEEPPTLRSVQAVAS